MSPDARLSEISRILAGGYLRLELARAKQAPCPADPPAGKNLSDSQRNPLQCAGSNALCVTRMAHSEGR